MGKSHLIVTNNLEFAENAISEIKERFDIKIDDPADLLSIRGKSESNTIGIEEIRQLKSWALLKPRNGNNKLAIIYQAELLSVQAQNTLLKTLEEPNTFTSIILITNSIGSLLDTIKSRCMAYEDPSIHNSEGNYELSFMESMRRIEEITKEKDKNIQRQKIRFFLVSILNNERTALKNGASIQSKLKRIETINKTTKMIYSNVSVKIALENLIFQLYQ
ncbi:MAG: hypothetical protein QY330_01915 [Candidatus Dojkabacteria bacterium]|uniref:DNA polymerase III subunit delta n=2 Tax=Candidatus Dojkabacteria TaxID=74243 RepID=A0A136KJF5_9BACT|nr:MAG: DNA polymerase III subunit delta' [candidate division WS6 bacterium OLB21]MBW7953197.1 hypothetical protein [Candidatus Dojkabacteria bacterium]WKZ28343.1 MAG: hypothetical protein QY330_01915 [Candidatus Dojkabacteria bacterium]